MKLRKFLAPGLALALISCTTSDTVVSTATPESKSAVASLEATKQPTVQPTAVPTATVPPSPTKKPVAKVGDTTETGGSKYVVNEVRDPVTSTNQFSKPADGMRWIAIDVTQEATKEGDSFNPFYFSVQDDKAFVYQRGGLGGPSPSLSSGTLALGQKVRGWVTFEIPVGAKIISIMTQPDPIGGSVVIADLTK